MQSTALRMLFTIVDRGKGESVAQLLGQEGVMIHDILLGNGTAHKDLLSLLGLRDTAKDVVISFVQSKVAERAMAKLNFALEIDLPGKGIAFTVPIGSVGGARTLQYMMSADSAEVQQENKEGKPMQMEQMKNSLVVTIVNRGYTDNVMEAARPAGAKGGTVLHARGAGTEEASKFFGITIQPEKEMVLILVSQEEKIPVMQAIARDVGPNTPAHGLVFSLPVDSVMGVAAIQQSEETQEAAEM